MKQTRLRRFRCPNHSGRSRRQQMRLVVVVMMVVVGQRRRSCCGCGVQVLMEADGCRQRIGSDATGQFTVTVEVVGRRRQVMRFGRSSGRRKRHDGLDDRWRRFEQRTRTSSVAADAPLAVVGAERRIHAVGTERHSASSGCCRRCRRLAVVQLAGVLLQVEIATETFSADSARKLFLEERKIIAN